MIAVFNGFIAAPAGNVARRVGGLLLVAVACILLCSCTVLEERDVCPNYLAVDFTGVDKSIKEWQMWLFNDVGELIFKDTVYRRSYPTPYIVNVPRYRNVRCLLWGNLRGATHIDEHYSYDTFIEKIEEASADSVYFFTDTISTKGENSYLKVIPEKEFATVDIYVKGWAGSDYEAEMVLECVSSGYYVGRELGSSRTSIKADIFDIGNYFTHFRCRMLRQKDTENMVLKLFIRDLNADGTLGEVLVDRELPLGEYLFENGYDMHKASLDDIVMEVDYSYNRFVIKVSDWEATYKMEEEI